MPDDELTIRGKGRLLARGADIDDAQGRCAALYLISKLSAIKIGEQAFGNDNY